MIGHTNLLIMFYFFLTEVEGLVYLLYIVKQKPLSLLQN